VETLEWFLIRLLVGWFALLAVAALLVLAGILVVVMYTYQPWAMAIPIGIAVAWTVGYFITEELM